jgi:hypothetical protein
MQPSGLRGVELARATGMWDALADVDDLVVPPDLAAALAARPPAQEHFAGFPTSTPRNVLRWSLCEGRGDPQHADGLTVSAAAEGRRVKSNGGSDRRRAWCGSACGGPAAGRSSCQSVAECRGAVDPEQVVNEEPQVTGPALSGQGQDRTADPTLLRAVDRRSWRAAAVHKRRSEP